MNTKLIIEILLSLGTGSFVGFLFTILNLPLPAPQVFSGVVGIFGVFLGSVIAAYFFKK